MNDLDYNTTDDSYSHDGESYDYGEVDDMLDSLMDPASDGDYAEARRKRRRSGPRGRQIPIRRAPLDVRRTADGIRGINARLNALDSRVQSVVSVAAAHSDHLLRLDRQMKADGALELVESLSGGQLNAFQLLKGAVKFGVIGGGSGALSNPMVIGGIGLLLRNPNILGNLGAGLGTTTAPAVS